MVLVRQRTQLKNRLHATLAKYALHDFEVSDVFGVRCRDLLRKRLELLPPHTAYASQHLLKQVEELGGQIREFEQRIQATFQADTGDSTTHDRVRGGADARRRHRARGGRCRTIRHRREARRLCGHHAPGPRKRREDAVRMVPARRQPLPQMGVRRGRERDLRDPPTIALLPRQSPLRAHHPSQGPPEGHRGPPRSVWRSADLTSRTRFCPSR